MSVSSYGPVISVPLLLVVINRKVPCCQGLELLDLLTLLHLHVLVGEI